MLGAGPRGEIVVEGVAEPLILKGATRITRGRPSAALRAHRSRRLALARRRTAARIEPTLEVGFENADAALRDLYFRRAGPFGEHALERSADNPRAVRGFVERENLHMCDLVALGRLVFEARRGTSHT